VRKFLTSGRRRYALLLFVAAGSLVLMGNQCQPPKPPPPPPTGLSISPTSHDFGEDAVSDGVALSKQVFTVTNNGPNTSGTLHVTKGSFNAADFDIDSTTCEGATLAAGDTCTVTVFFEAINLPGPRLANLIVSSDEPADGTATAELTGTAIA
jgi:hypothetical protein